MGNHFRRKGRLRAVWLPPEVSCPKLDPDSGNLSFRPAIARLFIRKHPPTLLRYLEAFDAMRRRQDPVFRDRRAAADMESALLHVQLD